MIKSLIICLLLCFSCIFAIGQDEVTPVSKARDNFNSKDYELAELEIKRAIFYGDTSVATLQLAVDILECQKKYSEAEFFRKKVNSQLNINGLNSVDILRRNKNSRLASIMSSIIPGLGQYYSGNFKQGISSQLLLGTVTGVSVLMFENYNPCTAILSSVPMFLRYYSGGIVNAGKCARRK